MPSTFEMAPPAIGSPFTSVAGTKIDRGVLSSVINDGVGPAGIPDALPSCAGRIFIRQPIPVRARVKRRVGTVEELDGGNIEGHRCDRIAEGGAAAEQVLPPIRRQGQCESSGYNRSRPDLPAFLTPGNKGSFAS